MPFQGPSFFISVFSTVSSKYVQYKIFPMRGFEPRTSSIGRAAKREVFNVDQRAQMFCSTKCPTAVRGWFLQ